MPNNYTTDNFYFKQYKENNMLQILDGKIVHISHENEFYVSSKSYPDHNVHQNNDFNSIFFNDS